MAIQLSELQSQAVALLKQLYLSENDQKTIEAAITERAAQRNCTRALAAQFLHHLAWN